MTDTTIKELSNYIFNYTKNNLSISEISNQLNITESKFNELLDNYPELKLSYDKGLIQSKIDYKNIIKKQASQGKAKALEKYSNIIDDNKLSNPPVIETREQKYIRMKAIRLMHYFSNISPEVLNYIKEKNGYDEFMNQLDWAYKNDKIP